MNDRAVGSKPFGPRLSRGKEWARPRSESCDLDKQWQSDARHPAGLPEEMLTCVEELATDVHPSLKMPPESTALQGSNRAVVGGSGR